MVVVEIVFPGPGGLEQLVDQTATALEGLFDRHNLEWSLNYPVTLRESLCLGLQQQMIGGAGSPAARSSAKKKVYRVGLALADGGLRAWTTQLVDRILAGCQRAELAADSKIRKELQKVLVAQIGPYMERTENSPVAAGGAR